MKPHFSDLYFVKKLFIALVALASLATMLAVGIGYLGHLHPALDTFSHFRFHYGVSLMVAAVVLLIFRTQLLALVCLVIGAIALYGSSAVLPFTAVERAAVEGKPVYKLIHLNLLWNNEHTREIMDWLIEHDPDILSFSEASVVWQHPLRRLSEDWPYLHNCPEYNVRGGVRLYSKWPMDPSINYCGTYGSYGKTRVTSPEGQQITIASLHLRWPWPASGPEQLEAILPEVKNLDPDTLVAGDFNATPWSHTVKRFASAGNLEVSPGIGPTWFFKMWHPTVRGLVGFPIDQVAAKGRVRILKAERMEYVESDHWPILVEFQID